MRYPIAEVADAIKSRLNFATLDRPAREDFDRVIPPENVVLQSSQSCPEAKREFSDDPARSEGFSSLLKMSLALRSIALCSGFECQPIDFMRSRWPCTLKYEEDGLLSLRLGLRFARGLRENTAIELEAARGQCAFASIEELARG